MPSPVAPPVIVEVAVNGATPRSVSPHVALEDVAGSTTPTDVELVDGAVALLADLGRRPATIAETRTILAVSRRG